MLLAAAASYVAPGESSIGVGKTSLSDAPRYLRLIERAIANDSSSLWNTFKTNPDYTWVLEHVSIPLARRYAAAIAHQRCVTSGSLRHLNLHTTGATTWLEARARCHSKAWATCRRRSCATSRWCAI